MKTTLLACCALLPWALPSISAAQIVANGDFSDSPQTSLYEPIPDWTQSYLPADTTSTTPRVGTASLGFYGTTFGPTGYGASDPANFAFLQVYAGDGNATAELLSQTIDLTGGQYYKLSFDSAPRNFYGGQGEVTLSNNGSIYETFAANSVNNSDFETLTYFFTAPLSTTSGSTVLSLVSLAGPTGDQTEDFTNVSIQIAPEPSTLGLLGAGLLGFASLFRRRRI